LITKDNILIHELIGLKVRVISGSSRPHGGIEGEIVFETLNTLVIRTVRGDKIVPKQGAIFEFGLPNGDKVRVNGSKLLNRPENRIKRGIRKIK